MTLRPKTLRGVLALALLAVFAFAGLTARAQEINGSISGTVTDNTGAVVKNATVVITNTDRNSVERTLTTNASGFYNAPSLPLGTYSVEFSFGGFKSQTVTGLVLNVHDALTVNRIMVVGSKSENVTVTASQVQLNLENGMSEGLINGTQIRQLELNSRNYEQLLLLQPGVSSGSASDFLYIGTTAPGGTSNQVQFSIDGSRPTSNNWTVDGADNVDRGSNLTLISYPSVDSIAEFKTLRGTYLAEYGRNAAGQIDVILRSGTNAFHGSAYEFFRNNIFNANAYFNKVSTPFVARPVQRYNDFGGTIGGPIWKDKTFFFFSYEGRRVISYSPVTALVPTVDEIAGDFSHGYNGNTAANVAVCTSYVQNQTAGTYTCGYGNQVTAISPTAQAYLTDIYSKVAITRAQAQANIGAGIDPHSLRYNQRNVFNDDQEIVRIDHSFGKLSFYYHFVHDSLPTQEPGGLFNGSVMPLVSNTTTTSPGTQQLGHATYTFSPSLVADLGYAYTYGAILSHPVGLGKQENSQDIGKNNIHPILPYSTAGTASSTGLDIIPTVSINGLTSVTNTGVYDDRDHNHNVFGSVTKTLGVHTFKAGFTWDRFSKHENALGNGSPYPQANFGFTSSGSATPSALTAAAACVGCGVPGAIDASLANFLLGNVNNSFTQGSAAVTVNVIQNSIEAYLQDDWKIRPRLTINLGVRYSFFAQPTDSNGLLSNFDPDTFNIATAQTVSSSATICLNGTACPNANGLAANGGAYNPNGDPLDGVILGTPGSFGHASPWGSKIATSQKLNFAPRVGFAYDAFGDGKTALRGGFGIAYDQSQVHPYENNGFNNKPFVNVTTIPLTNFDNPAAGNATLTSLPSVQGLSIHYKTPYTMQYSLDVQQMLSPTFSLDIGYFGSLSRHLEGVADYNTLRPGYFLTRGIPATGFTSAASENVLAQIRPYLGYLNVNITSTMFTANYNSLQVKTTKKFSGLSYIDANYTWSRALTTSVNDYSTGPQNLYNLKGDYGRAVYDRTNILTFDGVYELPWFRDQRGLKGHIIGGWELTGIYTIDSGLPLTVTESSSGGTIAYGTQTSVLGLANGGVANDSAGLGIMNSPDPSSIRPNMVLNPNNGYGQKIHTRQNWFYRPAFVNPAIGDISVGNEKRGAVEGPGFNRLDVGIFRNFRIKAANLQLRGEFFNALNHTNFQAVGTTATSAVTSFGAVTSARDNRVMQVAGKFTF